MRVLLNYDKAEKDILPSLAYIFRNMGIEAVSTAANLSISELLSKAKLAGCSAIVCNNDQTLRSLVPGDKPTVDKWRGSRLNFEVPTIIVNKLAHIHTVPHGSWLLEKDLLKLKSIYRKSMPFRYTKLLDRDDFRQALNELSSAIFIAYDIETKTAKEIEGSLEVSPTFITCASWTGVFPTGEMKTFVLPLIDYEGDHWRDDRDYIAAFKCMRAINALPIPKVMHNGMYDATHSIAHNVEPLHYTLDTMYLAHSEFSELPKSLDFVSSYLNYDYVYWKDEADHAGKKKDQEAYWAYNARDTWWTARNLIEQLRTASSYTFTNYKENFPTVYPSLYCNFEGVLIDNNKRQALREVAERNLIKARGRLQTMFADPNFNPGSWQQVEHYVYNVFGAKKPGVGKSKSSTDEKNLKVVAEQHPLLARLTDEILEYRGEQKAIGTYFDFLQKNGRLLYEMNPFGTETERMSCRSSSFWCGTQIQNIPGYAKEMLIADEGYELFEIDNKQSEGRTTAYFAQDEALIAALEHATQDFYKTLGTLFFNMPYEEVSDFFRNKVLKRIVHGTNYMMGAKTFIENIGVRILLETAHKLGLKIVDIVQKNHTDQRTLRGFATELLDAYHIPFPRVRLWYKEVYNEIANTGYLVSPMGHTRKFFGDIKKSHTMLRGAVAHGPQNGSVKILNKGMIKVYNQLVIPGNGDIRLKAQIHDSLFGQWKIELRDHYAELVTQCLYNPVVIHGRTLVIPTDLKYGHNWLEREVDKETGEITNATGTVKWKAPK